MNHSPRLFRNVSLSLLALGLVACSTKGPGKPPAFQPAKRQTHTVSEDMGRLVPQDAVVFAQVNSLGGIQAKVKELISSFQPGAERMVGLNAMYGFWKVRERDVDLTKPAGVALKMGQGPEPVLIVPAKNAKDLVDIAEAAVASGNYVAVAKGTEPSLAETASPLGSKLPDGDIAVRVRLDKVLAMVRPQIEMFLDPDTLAMMNPAAQQNATSKAGMEFCINWIKKLLDHAKTLEASMSLNDNKLDLGFALKVAAGSSLDAGPAKADRNLPYLAGYLPMPDASLVYMVSGTAEMQEAFAPMYKTMAEDLPAEQAAQVRALMQESQKVYKNLEDWMVVAADLTAKGAQLVAFARAKDAEKFKKDWDKLIPEYAKVMASGAMFGAPGIKLVKEDPVDISGVQFRVYTMTIDMAQMMEKRGVPLSARDQEMIEGIRDSVLGKGGLKIAVGLDGKNLITVMGDIKELGAKTVASLRENKRYKLSVVEAAAKHIHMNPGFLCSMDLRRLVSSIASHLPDTIAAKVPPVPQGAPIPMWFACAANGPVYELETHVDLGGIAGMAREMTPKRHR